MEIQCKVYFQNALSCVRASHVMLWFTFQSHAVSSPNYPGVIIIIIIILFFLLFTCQLICIGHAALCMQISYCILVAQ